MLLRTCSSAERPNRCGISTTMSETTSRSIYPWTSSTTSNCTTLETHRNMTQSSVCDTLRQYRRGTLARSYASSWKRARYNQQRAPARRMSAPTAIHLVCAERTNSNPPGVCTFAPLLTFGTCFIIYPPPPPPPPPTLSVNVGTATVLSSNDKFEFSAYE